MKKKFKKGDLVKVNDPNFMGDPKTIGVFLEYKDFADEIVVFINGEIIKYFLDYEIVKVDQNGHKKIKRNQRTC